MPYIGQQLNIDFNEDCIDSTQLTDGCITKEKLSTKIQTSFIETHVGIDSQTNYLLNNEVYSGETDILVFVDGLVQYPTTYSVIDSTTGRLASITVTNDGTGYVDATVNIDSAIGDNAIDALAVATIRSGRISDITLIQDGNGYTTVPDVTISGIFDGSAEATATLEFKNNILSFNTAPEEGADIQVVYFNLKCGISTIEVLDNSISAIHLGNNIITPIKIADLNITEDKLNGNIDSTKFINFLDEACLDSDSSLGIPSQASVKSYADIISASQVANRRNNMLNSMYLSINETFANHNVTDGFIDLYEDVYNINLIDSTGEIHVSDVNTGNFYFQPNDDSTNMHLVSKKIVANSVPNNVDVILLKEDVDFINNGDDFKLLISRDDGTSFSEIEYNNNQIFNNNIHMYIDNIDLSDQNSDSTMMYIINTYNNVNLKIHGISLMWD